MLCNYIIQSEKNLYCFLVLLDWFETSYSHTNFVSQPIDKIENPIRESFESSAKNIHESFSKFKLHKVWF